MNKRPIKNILIVLESIDVDDSSGSKANVALILNLSKIGYNVRVLHYSHKHIILPGVTCVLIKERKRTINFLLSRVQRIFSRVTGLHFHRFLENIFGFSFTFFNDAYSIKKAILKENVSNFDLILTLSKGASFRPHYALVQLRHLHHKWMAYVHDPFPHHCYPNPYAWEEPGYKQKERFFKEVSEQAAFSAFPSKLLQEWMGSYFPNFLKTGLIIPHQSIDMEIDNSSNSQIPTFFDHKKFNLLHAGNLMKQRSPKGLLEGFKIFLKNNPQASKHAQLILIGSASYHSNLLTAYQTEVPEIVVRSTNLPFEMVYNLQKLASVNIILEAESDCSPFLPGKFPHCIIANKPILHLGPKHSETRRLLGENYTYSCEANNMHSIAFCIEELYNQWLEKGSKFLLNRSDLNHYIAADYLKETLLNIESL